MTRSFNHNPRCPNCGHAVERQSKFSQWMRLLPRPYDSANFSLQNLDFVWHHYHKDWLITIEEKTHGGSSNFAQKDTHGILNQMLEYANGTTVLNERRRRLKIHYLGYYLVVFQNECPEDSTWVKINNKHVTRDEFMEWLNVGTLEHVPNNRGFVAFDVQQAAA